MDPAITLAKYTLNLKYQDIPAETVEATKKDVLDLLATTLGGSAAPGCREVVELIKEWGGKEESTILVYGGKVPAPHAAQVNASMGHALDYDDCHDPAGHHPAVAVIPSCFAIAERRGKVSGQEFLAAVNAGIDISCRLALATRFRTDVLYDGFNSTTVYGAFAAAAATGKLLGLDEKKMINALGFAYEQASGNFQCIDDGALSKRMGPGFAARGGIVSALMAEKGITAAQNSLLGKWGLYSIYYGGGVDLDALTGELGERFETANVSLKAYPCCKLTHTFIDASLALKKEYNLKVEDIAEATAFVGHRAHAICEPGDIKRSPRTIVDAQFSVPWNVANALVGGKVGMLDFTAEHIKDEVVLQVAQKVKVKVDDSLTRSAIEPAIVEVRTRDGRVLTRRVDYSYGTPQNPMTWDSLMDKLAECAARAARPIHRQNLEKVFDMVQRLEHLDDASQVVRLLC